MAKLYVVFGLLALLATIELGNCVQCYHCAVLRRGDNCEITDRDTEIMDCGDTAVCSTFSFIVDDSIGYVPLIRTCVASNSDCDARPPAENLSYCNVCRTEFCNDDVYLG